ncbi:MAG: hypothetical protein ACXWN8_14695 [Isosphaeraceae bacterium]
MADEPAPTEVTARDRAGSRGEVEGENELLAGAVLERAVVQPGDRGASYRMSDSARAVCGGKAARSKNPGMPKNPASSKCVARYIKTWHPFCNWIDGGDWLMEQVIRGKVSAGRVVLPAELRKEFGIEDGADITSHPSVVVLEGRAEGVDRDRGSRLPKAARAA